MTASLARSVTVPSSRVAPGSEMMSKPMFEVRMMVAAGGEEGQSWAERMRRCNERRRTVLKVDGAALRVGELALVEKLKKDVGDVCRARESVSEAQARAREREREVDAPLCAFSTSSKRTTEYGLRRTLRAKSCVSLS